MDTTLKVEVKDQPIVVSQTGNGDYKSIAKAVERAWPGATIKIKSGYYEEALVISKPLSLIGDPEGLVIITNSDFSLLTVSSTELKLAHLALVSGLQMPSLDIRASTVDFRESILWTLDIFLKKINPSLMPARALAGESFLGESLRNSIPIRMMIADLLDRQSAGGLAAQENGPSTNEQPGSAQSAPPDVLLSRRSRFNAANSFIGLAHIVANERSTMAFSDCRFDYASLTSWEIGALSLAGCDLFGEAGRPRVCLQEGDLPAPPVPKPREPDLLKREREAILRLRVQKWAAQNQTGPVDYGDYAERKAV